LYQNVINLLKLRRVFAYKRRKSTGVIPPIADFFFLRGFKGDRPKSDRTPHATSFY